MFERRKDLGGINLTAGVIPWHFMTEVKVGENSTTVNVEGFTANAMEVMEEVK